MTFIFLILFVLILFLGLGKCQLFVVNFSKYQYYYVY